MTLSFEERKQIWWDWHKENPQVWQYFEKFALEAVGLGRKKVSHWLIINRIRWEVTIVKQVQTSKSATTTLLFMPDSGKLSILSTRTYSTQNR